MKGFCLQCSKEIEVQICCNGYGCGCQGLPEYPFCGNDCFEEYNKPENIDTRRKQKETILKTKQVKTATQKKNNDVDLPF